jgi:hypothetical protein
MLPTSRGPSLEICIEKGSHWSQLSTITHLLPCCPFSILRCLYNRNGREPCGRRFIRDAADHTIVHVCLVQALTPLYAFVPWIWKARRGELRSTASSVAGGRRGRSGRARLGHLPAALLVHDPEGPVQVRVHVHLPRRAVHASAESGARSRTRDELVPCE